jgi:hypothetical protein
MIRAVTGPLIPIPTVRQSYHHGVVFTPIGEDYVRHLQRQMALSRRHLERETRMLDAVDSDAVTPGNDSPLDVLQHVATALGLTADADADELRAALEAAIEAAGGTPADDANLTPAQLAICAETGCSPRVFASLKKYNGMTLSEYATSVREREANAERIDARRGR